MLALEPTKRVREMFGFRCGTYGAWYDANQNQFWGIDKTLGLHTRNGRCDRKRVTMYRLVKNEAGGPGK